MTGCHSASAPQVCRFACYILVSSGPAKKRRGARRNHVPRDARAARRGRRPRRGPRQRVRRCVRRATPRARASHVTPPPSPLSPSERLPPARARAHLPAHLHGHWRDDVVLAALPRARGESGAPAPRERATARRDAPVSAARGALGAAHNPPPLFPQIASTAAGRRRAHWAAQAVGRARPRGAGAGAGRAAAVLIVAFFFSRRRAPLGIIRRGARRRWLLYACARARRARARHLAPRQVGS